MAHSTKGLVNAYVPTSCYVRVSEFRRRATDVIPMSLHVHRDSDNVSQTSCHIRHCVFRSRFIDIIAKPCHERQDLELLSYTSCLHHDTSVKIRKAYNKRYTSAASCALGSKRRITVLVSCTSRFRRRFIDAVPASCYERQD